jgi:DNA polymerase alpha subunit A
MKYEIGEREIYNQLVYFASLWDVEKAKAAAAEGRVDGKEGGRELTGEQRESIRALAEHNRVRFENVKGVVERYLDRCGRQWVAMFPLFATLGLAPAAAA